MYLARKGLGGHGPYGQVRAASEILEVRKKKAHHSSWNHHSARDAKLLGIATSTSTSSVANPMAENLMMRAGAQAVQRAPHTLPTTSASDSSSAVGWEHTSSAQAMDEVLPEGWQKLTDPSSGNDYFANQVTGEALWTKPDNTALKQVAKSSLSVANPMAVRAGAVNAAGLDSDTHTLIQQIYDAASPAQSVPHECSAAIEQSAQL
jgi:hypothetical protein